MKILTEFPKKESAAPSKQMYDLMHRRKITPAKRPVVVKGQKNLPGGEA